MKKFIVFLCILGFPLNVFAYSSKVYLGGNTIGIDIKNDGIMVIGFYKVDGNMPDISLIEGDIITKVGNTKVSSINELTKAIEENIIDSNLCTVCNSNMFHSRRIEGEKYQANASLMMLKGTK